ncbi:S4 domain-containing protein YaaA [Candidatus Izemoplasma sp. B36]|uniref:S4 domain-containing protein YaaA n=1 Tax=Candidatus Izemoplasma sp. B36 TaxID=3242468 RepID=UPI003558284D
MEKITIKTEYITLGQLLKFLSIVSSGGEAKIFLQTYEILLNDEPENRRGKKIYPGDIVLIQSEKYLITKNES